MSDLRITLPKLITLPEQTNPAGINGKGCCPPGGGGIAASQSIFQTQNIGFQGLNVGDSFVKGTESFNRANNQQIATDPKTGDQVNHHKAEEINQLRYAQYTQEVDKNNEGIRLHEEAHLGERATSGINLDEKTDEFGNTIVTGGHVMVALAKFVNEKMPMDKIREQILGAQQTKEQAEGPQTKGVPAPYNELSNADLRIASQSLNMLTRLRDSEQKRLRLEEQIASVEGKKPEGVIDAQRIERARNAEHQGDSKNGNARRNQIGQVINFTG